MKIVGVGCGPGMLTEEAVRIIKSATLIIGSERSLSISAGCIPKEAEIRIIDNYKELKTLPDHAVILSTGDPMISGMGYLGGEITPGISSIQYGAAKTGISLTGIYICSAHGRDHKKAIGECCTMVKLSVKVVIITDPSFPLLTLAKSLEKIDPSITLTICENLGYPDERIESGNVSAPPVLSGNPYILFIKRETI